MFKGFSNGVIRLSLVVLNHLLLLCYDDVGERRHVVLVVILTVMGFQFVTYARKVFSMKCTYFTFDYLHLTQEV